MVSQRTVSILFWSGCIVNIVLPLLVPNHQDYTDYMHMWDIYLQGNISPVYPIGFLVLFAPLYAIWEFFPQVVFSACFVGGCIVVYLVLYKSRAYVGVPLGIKQWAVLSLALSPVFMEKVFRAFFDPVIGLLLLCAFLMVSMPRINGFARDLVALSLIGLAVLVKFIGILVLVPWILMAEPSVPDLPRPTEQGTMHAQHAPRRSWKLVIFSRAAILVALGLVLVVILLPNGQLSTLVRSFWLHGDRDYNTFFDIIPLAGGEVLVSRVFFLELFDVTYSNFGVYIFVAAIGITYFMSMWRKVSRGAFFLAPLVVFVTFYHVSHTQFVIWFAFIFTLYYARAVKTPKSFLVRAALLQLVAGALVHFFIPFSQFLYGFFIVDIFIMEARGVGEFILDPVFLKKLDARIVSLPPGEGK